MIIKDDLKKSAVVFDEATHTYRRGEREFSGITSLIHQVLMLGVYPDASDFVMKVQIPKAGYYGTCVHKAIQTYDEIGIECTEYPEKEHPTAGTLPAQDVTDELETYKDLSRSLRTIACEFTVDYGDFASQIDSVKADKNDGIYLVDYKTNNLDYYPGGEAGLREYLSWQLSCYAFMFEHQTGLKVKGLLAMWLRKKEGERWVIERKSDEDVQCLLSTVITRLEPGKFIYFNEKMQVYDTNQFQRAVTKATQSLAVPQEITKAIADLLRAEKIVKTMKEKLRELMEQNGVTKWECDEFTASISKDSEATTFDTTSFKKSYPEIYKQFTKTTTRKGAFKITSK